MESKSYKELQALAKLHGIRANQSKGVLIDRLQRVESDPLASHDKVHECMQGNAGDPQDGVDMPLGNAGECQDEFDTPQGNASDLRGDEPDKPLDVDSVPGTATAEAHDRVDTEFPAPLNPVEPEVPVGSSERCKNDRLSAAKKKSRTVSESSRKAKLKQPTAGPARRFERMHQNLFAGQASIETYGKTPKKKTAPTPAKENPPLSKVTPVRPVAFGSGVKSAKRGLTVASKPCTLIVQRSNKKPTQIKEFRLSSNQSGKREPFKPYSGPVRPMSVDNKPGFNIGSNSSASAQVPRKNKNKPGIKSKLASGKAQSARKAAHWQSSKFHRERVITEARDGRS